MPALPIRWTEQRSSERAVDSRFPSEANGSSARSRLPVLPPGGFARCFRLKQAHRSLFSATKTVMSSVERMPTG